MGTRTALIAIAKGKIGYCEVDGQNQGPIVLWACEQWLPRGWDISKPHPITGKMGWAAWCAGFVSTCILRAGFDFSKIGSLSVDTLLHRCQGKYVVHVHGDGYVPQTGDIIFFGPEGNLSHCGLVDYAQDGDVYTIEGNAGNCVRSRKHSLSDPKIYGYCNLFTS